jgi:hypothetical protein
MGEPRTGLVRCVDEQRPRLHPEGTGERFKGRHVEALQGLAREQSVGQRWRDFRERGELVGVLQPMPPHDARKVVSDHETNTSINAGT